MAGILFQADEHERKTRSPNEYFQVDSFLKREFDAEHSSKLLQD